MDTVIHAIGTAVPPHAYHQDYALHRMKQWVRDHASQRIAHRVYRHSGIERRFSVLPDFQPGSEPVLFRESADGQLIEPSTGARNAIFETSYPELIRDAAQRAFDAAPQFTPGDVTHVITVSCTGFTNPGPDLFLTHAFSLSPGVERYHLGFMGCYAAFPALRMADQFCRARPNAVVLICCVELCSLHLQIRPTPDSLMANALFADGAAVVLVSAQPAPVGEPVIQLRHFVTRLVPEGEKDMAWTIGDRGFDMILSSYVPRILGLHARDLVGDMLSEAGITTDDLSGWAVHPGGKAILSAFEKQLGLPDDALSASYAVLREYGNMSSATILFVLQRMLEDRRAQNDGLIAALVFGPGLTVEMGLLHMLGCGRVATPTIMAREDDR